MVIDYSAITIDGMLEKDWLSYRQVEQPDYNAKDELEKELKPTAQNKLVANINEKIGKKGAYVVLGQETNYTINIVVARVDRNGNNTCLVSVTDKNGNEITSFVVRGEGGVFGTMANLWGDGFEETGEAIGKKIAKLFN